MEFFDRHRDFARVRDCSRPSQCLIYGYTGELLNLDGPVVYAAFYALFIGIHLWAQESLKIMLAITAVAVLALLLFVVGMLPHFSLNNLLDIPLILRRFGAGSGSPRGIGVFGAPFPSRYGCSSRWRGLIAEERDPRDMPRGIITAMLILLLLGGLVLFPGSVPARLIWRIMRHLWWAHCKVFTGGFVARDGGGVVGLAGLVPFFSPSSSLTPDRYLPVARGGLSSLLALCHQRAQSLHAGADRAGGIPGLGSHCGAGDGDYDGGFWGDAFLCADDGRHIVLRPEAWPESAYRTTGGIVTTESPPVPIDCGLLPTRLW